MEAITIQKYKEKSVPQLIKLAEKHFNAYIRKRDSQDGYFVCISCNITKPITQLNAGHNYSAGQHPVVRFEEDNVFGQCIRCNCHLHGNLANYRINLIKRIGIDRVKAVDDKVAFAKTMPFHWDRFSLIDIIETYKNK